ncbi:hypothetical protein CRG98_007560 [Punica granatum]|uniref:Uncharacterized protein n=1 Tax=Punica granatum TaxID=22663 RepID=A0A2I0KU59_PUNGR|nr:hypothetical protein CRG98_007560 [Punica granatum]
MGDVIPSPPEVVECSEQVGGTRTTQHRIEQNSGAERAFGWSSGSPSLASARAGSGPYDLQGKVKERGREAIEVWVRLAIVVEEVNLPGTEKTRRGCGYAVLLEDAARDFEKYLGLVSAVVTAPPMAISSHCLWIMLEKTAQTHGFIVIDEKTAGRTGRVGSDRSARSKKETARRGVGLDWISSRIGTWAAADGLGWLGWTCNGNAMGRSPLVADSSDGNAGGAERLRSAVPAVGCCNDGAKRSGNRGNPRFPVLGGQPDHGQPVAAARPARNSNFFLFGVSVRAAVTPARTAWPARAVRPFFF